MTTASRVLDARKPITSRTGLDRAEKARDTLETAQAICRASSVHSYVADAIQGHIDSINRSIAAYYRDREAGS